jgi:hypothetical protein
MIIPIKTDANITVDEMDITETSFRSLNLKESHIEEFIRSNIELLLTDESLLIIGSQVTNSEKGRSDLTAIDENGNLVLIEIKRDVEDIKARKEELEFQAIRYAAGYAKIKTPEELVDKIFAPYVTRYEHEFDLGGLTPHEKATRILESFLEKNNALKTFNKRQRIILIASSFDRQTESAVAWLIANHVDISCFTLKPLKVGGGLFLEINRLLPPQLLEDFYVEISEKKIAEVRTEGATGITRTYLPRMDKLFEWGHLKAGDTVVVKNFDDSDAVVRDTRSVEFHGEVMTFNNWAEKVTGWSAVNIYEWTLVKGETKTLDQKRREKMAEFEE